MYCTEYKIKVSSCGMTSCQRYDDCQENFKNLSAIEKSSKENKL